ncbi:unnamed protein product [Sphagnum jensenii]|uniref:Uncharacterized protein n=1 Tax=Sphagnum jensenii TaxID=128206 RepID=A0ABP0WAC1_9BRYO
MCQLGAPELAHQALPLDMKLQEHKGDGEILQHREQQQQLGSDKNRLPEKSKNHKRKRNMVPYYKLYQYADLVDVVLMVLGTLAAICNGLILPALFIVQERVVNSFGNLESNPQFLYKRTCKNSTYFVYVSLVGCFTNYLEASCWMWTGERQSAKIRAKYLRGIMRQNVGYFDNESTSTSEVVNSVSADTMVVQEAISEKVGNFIQNMSLFFSGYLLGFWLVWRMALVTLPFLPLLLIPGGFYNRAISGLALQMQVAYNKAGIIAEQSISSVRTVYSFVGEDTAVKAYSDSLNKTVELGIKQGLAKGLAIGSIGVNFAIWAFMAWYGSKQVLEGYANGAEVMYAGIAVIIGGIALGNATPHFKSFSEGCVAAFNIFELINRVPPIDADDVSGRKLDKVEGNLELRNIDFTYPSRTEAPIFQNFSLCIPAGKTVALVGSSGSGKSTIIALLERFYDPLAGEVLIDGVNIKELQVKWLRCQIGLVSQEPALFATTIKENILYGKDSATMDEVVEAAKSANAYNFIIQLPQGFDTQVGERGVQLSGGQKQRIAIARAMLKKPPVLLLDEATSALDAESEKVVQQALERAAVGRTTVVVAHRLSTVRTADNIAVVQAGKVLEMGSHDELLARGKSSAYAALIHLQEAQQEAENYDHDIDVVKSSDQFESSRSSHHNKQSFKVVHASFTQGIQAKVCNSVEDSNPLAFKANRGFEDKPQVPSFYRLIALNKPEWKQALLGLTGALGFGFVQPAYAYVLGNMVGAYYTNDPSTMQHDVKIYSTIFMVLSVAAFVVNILQHYNFAIIGEYLTKRIRVQMLANILRNEVGWYDRDENASGAISSRLASDANMIRSLVGDRISLLVQVVGAMSVSFIVALIVLWKLALVMISVQPLILFCYYMKKKLLTRIAVASIQAQQNAAQVASEAVAQHRTVTAFSAQDKILRLFEKKLEKSNRDMVVRSQVAGLGLGAATFCLYASFGLDFWYGGLLASKGQATLTQVLKVFLVIVSSVRVLAEAGTLTPDVAKGAAAAASVFEILDHRTEIDANNPKAEKVEKVDGNIEFLNVQFAYPSRPDVMVFKNFSLKVDVGSTVAMVGQSGSGKSTIIGLIERFYDPLQGSVMIDGKDIRNLHLQSLRQHIGLVSQEPTLFACSLRENIAYGKKDATEAEIVEAARAANAHNFISALPNGYDTFAGERGLQLSGGQKQRVAIARAVLKNPAILLLDEATSALDMASERLVQNALDSMMVGRTTIVVAHRLSTIQGADKIAVLQDGAILEQGRHEELLARGEGGAYYALICLQTQSK